MRWPTFTTVILRFYYYRLIVKKNTSSRRDKPLFFSTKGTGYLAWGDSLSTERTKSTEGPEKCQWAGSWYIVGAEFGGQLKKPTVS
jgi:hypothetical protein